MTAIDLLFAHPVAYAVAWALVQFIWQGAAVGLFTALALAVLRRSAPDVRYVVATIGLALMATMPVVTAVQTGRTAPSVNAARVVYTGLRAQNSVLPPTETQRAVPADWSDQRAVPAVTAEARRVDGWLPVFLALWMTGVAILTLRLMSGWLWVQRIRSRGTAASGALQEMAARLARRLHIRRRVSFLQSTVVDVPTVIGWLRPVVLVPAGALAGLSPRQLEVILAHELAHIRRHDYLVNLLQTLVETLLFYHPAVWWLSRRIRAERENCCDDLAVSLCGDPVAYACALADLEQLRGSPDRFAIAATDGSLLLRVRRLLGAPSHAGREPGWLAGTAAVLLMTVLAAGAVRSEAFSDAQPRAEAVAASPAQPSGPVVASAPPTAAEGAQEAAAMAHEVARSGQGAEAAKEDAAGALAPAAGGDRAPALAAAGQSGNFTWSDGKQKLQVNYKGAVEFTDDDTDVKSLSPGGWLRIRDGADGRAVEFRADDTGRIERRYWVGGSERPFEPEGRQWLAQALPRFIRQTGIGAGARVARILRSGGPEAVLAEISLIEGSWARRVYYAELLQSPGLDAGTLQLIITRAGRDIESDFELASLLIKTADRLLVDEATRRAYFEAAKTIQSDFEMRRVLSAPLKQGPLAPDLLAGLLDTATSIGSDFEQASLLIAVLKVQGLDGRTRGPFFKALDSVGSAFERRRVLSSLVAQSDTEPDTLVSALDSAAAIGSDFEKASFLLDVVKRHSIEGSTRQPFFRVVNAIGSSFERGRVLKTVAKRSDTSAETVVEILRAAQTMSGNFETSQVLLAVAGAHNLTGPARDRYIEVAERLGEFEQGRAMTALVRSERK
ncbi:MAG TPA: M56 family metallopeptidase [Vicinamibacterales bacterium]|nr:M56 family metallopeptidase [Vicinamibacterales bacterium]